MLPYLLIAILGVSPGPVPFPADGAWKKSPVVGSSDPLGYHLGNSTWYGAPAPTIDCLGSEPLPSSTWTTPCTGTCPAGDNITIAGKPAVRGVLSLRVQATVTGPPAKIVVEPTWTPTGGLAQTAPAFDVLLPATSLHLWGSTGLEDLRGVYLTAPTGIDNYASNDTYTATVGTAPGEMVCNGNRSYGTATATGDQHGSAAINLTTTCVLGYPSGVPPYVRVVDSVIGGSGVILPVSGCNVGTSILLLGQSVPSNYTGNLTFYPSGSAYNVLAPVRIGSPTTVGTPFYSGGYDAAVATNDPSVGQQKAVVTDASNNFNLGDTAEASSMLTLALVFKKDSVGNYPINKYAGTSGDSSYTLYDGGGGTMLLRVCSSVSNCTSSTASAVIPAGSWAVCVGAYLYSGTPGTSSRLGLNCNNTEVSLIENAVGPIANSATDLKIGGSANASIARATIWTNWSASATERDKMVRGMVGLLASKPQGTALPFTRADTGFVCPVVDSECYWVGSGIPEIDRRGIWVGGAAGNLLADSNVFTGWTQFNAIAALPVVTQNGGGDPWGGSTGTRIQAPSVGAPNEASIHYINRGALAAGTYTLSVWAKSHSGAEQTFDLGIAKAGNTALQYTRCTVTTGSWCTLTATLVMDSWYPHIGTDTRAGLGLPGAAFDIDVQAVQLTTVSVRTPFRATAGAIYTGVATTHQGVPPRTDTTTWTNLALQSEDISTTWANVNTAEAVNTAVASDGSFSADKLYENDTTNGFHYLLQTYTATAAPTTMSLEAKAGERPWLFVSMDAGASSAKFNMTTCAAGTATGVTSTAAALADGWCKFTLSKTMTAGATSVRIFLCSDESTCSYAGEVGKGAYLSRLQLTATATDQPYCPTTTAASTCGNTGGLGKTVVNALTYSESPNLWTGGDKLAVSDFGSAKRLTDTADGGASVHYLRNPYTATAVPWSFRAKVKAETLSWILFTINDGGGAGSYFNAATCAKGTALGSVAAGAAGALDADGFCQVWFTVTPTAGANFIRVWTASGDGGVSYQGTGAGTLLIKEMQLEASASAGRYCGPTGASAKTCTFVERPAQPWAISVTANLADWSQGANAYLWAMNYPGAINSARTYAQGTGGLMFDIWDNLPVGRQRYNSVDLSTGQHVVTSSTLGDGDFPSVTVDGAPLASSVTAGTGTALQLRAPTVIHLGEFDGSGGYLNGWIKKWATCTSNRGCK